MEHCEWSSRRNIVSTGTHNISVPESELYLSRTSDNQVFKHETNSYSKSKTTCGKDGSLYKRKAHVMSNQKRKVKADHKQISIQEYIFKSKKQRSIKNETSLKQKNNIVSEPLFAPEQIYQVSSSTKNINESNETQSSSKFSIDVALQLSSQISNVNSSSRFKTYKEITDYFPLKKTIHKKSNGRKIFHHIDERARIGSCMIACTTEHTSYCDKPIYSKNGQNYDRRTKTIDWDSRGFKRIPESSKLSVPTSELFIKNKKCQISEYLSQTINFPEYFSTTHKNEATTKRKNRSANKKSSRLINSYQHFSKKNEIFSRQEENSNSKRRSFNKNYDDRNYGKSNDQFNRKMENGSSNENICTNINSFQNIYKVIQSESSNEIKHDISDPLKCKYEKFRSCIPENVGFYQKNTRIINPESKKTPVQLLNYEEGHNINSDSPSSKREMDDRIISNKKSFNQSSILDYIPTNSKSSVLKKVPHRDYSGREKFSQDGSEIFQGMPSQNHAQFELPISTAPNNIDSDASSTINSITKNVKSTNAFKFNINIALQLSSQIQKRILHSSDKETDGVWLSDKIETKKEVENSKLYQLKSGQDCAQFNSLLNSAIKNINKTSGTVDGPKKNGWQTCDIESTPKFNIDGALNLRSHKNKNSVCSSDKITDCVGFPDQINDTAYKNNLKKENFQLVEKFLSQNQENQSQPLTNVTIHTASRKFSHIDQSDKEIGSQENSNLLLYTLSQDCPQSDSLLSNAFKNINNETLCTKGGLKKSNIRSQDNQTAPKFNIDVALQMGSQIQQNSLHSSDNPMDCRRVPEKFETIRERNHLEETKFPYSILLPNEEEKPQNLTLYATSHIVSQKNLEEKVSQESSEIFQPILSQDNAHFRSKGDNDLEDMKNATSSTLDGSKKNIINAKNHKLELKLNVDIALQCSSQIHENSSHPLDNLPNCVEFPDKKEITSINNISQQKELLELRDIIPLKNQSQKFLINSVYEKVPHENDSEKENNQIINNNYTLSTIDSIKNSINNKSFEQSSSFDKMPTDLKTAHPPPLSLTRELEKQKVISSYSTNQNVHRANSENIFEKIQEKCVENIPLANMDNNILNKSLGNINYNSINKFIGNPYDALEAVSSPIIMNPECQQYLKDLINGFCKTPLHSLENVTDEKDNSNRKKKKILDDISSHNESQYQNPTNFTIDADSQKVDYSEKENFSQDGSEIFQYILSQDFVESDSLMNNTLKNMNNLSQKITEKRNLIFYSNKNSTKLLEIALNIYSQHKEKSILSKFQSPTTALPSKFTTIRKFEGGVGIYKIIKHNENDLKTDDEIIENESTRFCADDTTMRSEVDKKILAGLKEICENKSYLYSHLDDGPNSVKTRFDIINEIKIIFEQIMNDFNAQKSPYLEIRRQTFDDCTFVNSRLQLKSEDHPKMIRVKYKTTLSQFKFCLMMYILAKVLQVLETNSKTTRRELYYQIKHLISDQRQIDRAVKAVSCMLCVGPWDLNIVAQKGLVFGNLKIAMSSNEIVDCNLPGTLIPQDIDEIVEFRSPAYFILVVEKESIFYKLLEEDLPNKLVRPFLMITGKGFPDLNTQLFLKKLWMVMSIPILIFTDADPHGVNIMMTYRFGSLSNAHLGQQLAIPKAQWLGVFPSEVVRLNADKQVLTEMERNLTKNLLKTPYMKMNRKIEEELKFMLDYGYKAGIEGIIKNNTFLSEFYFPLKFHNKDLI